MTKKSNLTSIFYMLFASSLLFIAAPANAEYCIQIIINNPGSEVVDYTYRVIFTTADSAIYNRSAFDLRDWRFKKADGTNFPFWIQTDYTGYKDTVLVRLDTLKAGATDIYLHFSDSSLTAASNGAATCIAFWDFDTDAVFSGSTNDILSHVGYIYDTLAAIKFDTTANFHHWREQGNLFINPDAADTTFRYLIAIPGYAGAEEDSCRIFLGKSSNGIDWTNAGRIDTMGGNSPAQYGYGQDPFIVEWKNDTLLMPYENKSNFDSPLGDGSCQTDVPLYVKCDRVGLWYSVDEGASWTDRGIIINDSIPAIPWLASPSSPTMINVGDTVLYLAVEVKGTFPDAGHNCGSGTIALFRATSAFGTYDTVRAFPCSTAVSGQYPWTANVPDDIFSVDENFYLMGHGRRTGDSPSSWQVIRGKFNADWDTLTDLTYSVSSVIFTQDVLNDSEWVSIVPNAEDSIIVRVYPLISDDNAISGLHPFRSWITYAGDSIPNGGYGYIEAKNGELHLQCEPWKGNNGRKCVGVFTDKIGLHPIF